MKAQRSPDASLNATVLCVDDEAQILEALALTLGRRFNVEMAAGGQAALEKLNVMPNVAVIVSDLQMPSMNGTQFLAASHTIAPQARRILITGRADVTSAIAAVNDGRIFRFLTKPCSSAQLVEAVQAAVADFDAESQRDLTLRRKVERAILETDSLTDLLSRDGALSALRKLRAETPAADRRGAAIFAIELVNSLELFDDSNSGAAEDLLRQFAGRFSAHFPEALCIARFEPHTFVAVVGAGDRSEAELRRVGLGLADALSEPLDIDGGKTHFGICVGVSSFDIADFDPVVVIKQAEVAAHEASRRGVNSVCVATPESSSKAKYHREQIRALRAAISEGQISLSYQPIIDIRRNGVHSVEALARWNHPHLGYISPATFIPMAEESGLIVPLGEWVLRQACQEGRHFLGSRCPRINVNVSVRQVLDTGFLNSIFVALESARLEAAALEIEVTESIFAGDLDRICLVLSELRGLGVSVAIDDFGTGYSSLSYLNRLPVDVVKTDLTFMRDFDRGGAAIIGAALDVTRKLDLECIIEGVETDQLLEGARALGANLLQGYLFARPMPASALLHWLERFPTRHHDSDRMVSLAG